MKKKSSRLLIALILTALVVMLVHIILKYISVVIYNEKHAVFFELSNRLDMNDENSIPQWFTATALIAISVASGLAAYMSKPRKLRRLWAVISGATLLLSVDDMATLHEYILQMIHVRLYSDAGATVRNNAWFVIIPFVLIGLIWLAYAASKRLPRKTTIVMIFACFVYFFGVVAMDTLVNGVPPRSFLGQGLLAAIEGGLQLMGSYIFLYAVIDYLEDNHGSAIRSAVGRLRSADNG